MDKTNKLAPAIILFVILFFITEEVASSYNINQNVLIYTSLKCTSAKQCPDQGHRSNYFFSMCMDGYCVKWIVSNQ
jgi:hypothetical protein